MPSLEEMKRRKRALESLVPSLSVDDVPASTDIDLSGADIVAPAVGGLRLPESDVSEWAAPPPPPAPRVDSAPPLVSADVEAPAMKSPGLREARGMDSRAQLRRALELAGRQVSAGLLNQRPPSQADLVTQPGRYTEEAQGDFNNDVRQQMERRRDALAALRESNTAKTLDYNMQELARRKAQDETGLDFKKKQLDTTVDEKAKDRAAKEAAAEAKRQAAIAAAKTAAAKAAKAAEDQKKAGGLKTADDLRKEFNALPEVKDYKDVDTAVKKVEAAAKDVSAAGDLALIYAYMRVLDPGSSVKEGEFQAAAQAGGAGDRLVASIGKAMSGERLSPDQRADFLSHAQTLREAQRSRAQGAAEKYRGIASKRGADPNDVVEEGEAKPSTIQMRFPDGSVHPVPQAKLDAARRRGGIPVP
jgi:ADP-ribose pyrophosphatase YjhB (NUDIX family)